MRGAAFICHLCRITFTAVSDPVSPGMECVEVAEASIDIRAVSVCATNTPVTAKCKA